MKPRPTATLETGKIIDSQQGFVDTFNWMKRVCENLKGDGLTIEVDRSDEDAPVIGLTDGVLANIGGGGGGGEETTLKGNTSDSTEIGPGDLNFKSGDYSNVEVETNGTDITISVFYIGISLMVGIAALFV